VAQIFRQDGIALLGGSRGDQQIVERQHIPFRRFLAFDLPNQVSPLECDRMEGHQLDQLVDKSLPVFQLVEAIQTAYGEIDFGTREKCPRVAHEK